MLNLTNIVHTQLASVYEINECCRADSLNLDDSVGCAQGISFHIEPVHTLQWLPPNLLPQYVSHQLLEQWSNHEIPFFDIKIKID